MRLLVALSFILLATSAVATSVFTMKLTKPRHNSHIHEGYIRAELARAALLKSRTPGGPTTVSATSFAYQGFITSVDIGHPATSYNLIVDITSANTICGLEKPYVRTATSVPTGQNVSRSYYQGASFTGLEYLDQVALASNLVVTNQSIGDALSSYEFPDGVDGILGFGRVDLTRGTLSPDTSATISTVMNNLVSQGLIEQQVLGVYFAPATSSNDTNGALTYGGVDSSLYEGELTYVPVTKTLPAGNFWGINVTLCTYGTQTIFSTSTAGIVDTRLASILLADDYFNAYLNAIPGAKLVNNSKAIIDIPRCSIKYMRPLNFTIGGRVFTMDVASQLIPRTRNPALGLDPDKQYGVVAKLGSNSGEGLDIVFGSYFLERHYAVFDTDAMRVGFAQTNNTFSTYQE